MTAPRHREGKRHLHTLHTVWIYWPDDDAIEMHGAVDQHLLDANPDFYVQMLGEARSKVGGENVREVRVEVDWRDISKAFEPSRIAGEVEGG